MKYLLIFLLLVGQVRAEESVVFLEKGKPSPIDGFGITVEKAKAVRLLDLNYQFEQKKTAALTEESSILTQRLNNMKDENDRLAKRLAEDKDSGFFSKTAFFILGAGVASLVAFGAAKAVK